MTAIGLRVAALSAEALDVEHREPKDLHLGECLLHRLEFGRLDDGDDQLHGGPSGEG